MSEQTIDTLKLILGSGATGVLAWVVWHAFKVLIPDLTTKFAEVLREEREASREERAMFRDELRENREVFRLESAASREHVSAHTRELRESIDGLKAAVHELNGSARA